MHENQAAKTWTQLSETEKEILLAEIVMSYLNYGVKFVSPDEIKRVLKRRDSSSTQSNEGGCFLQCCKTEGQEISEDDEHQNLI